jgi:hypothetical protein
VEELDDLLGLGADDAAEEEDVVSIDSPLSLLAAPLESVFSYCGAL